MRFHATQKCGLEVAGTLFGLLGALQLARVAFRPEVMVSGRRMPLWPSIVATGVLGGLSAWMWRLACDHADEFEAEAMSPNAEL